MTKTTKPGVGLALALLASDMDEAIAWLLDRYDYCAEKGVNAEGQHYHDLSRVQAELMRLSRVAESPVDPIPSGSHREAPPEVVASPSRAAGPLSCACGRYELRHVPRDVQTVPNALRGVTVMGCDGQVREDHRFDSCTVGGRVVAATQVQS